ncbi:bifunctional glutamate N-acetyltransferase/amino-acid acetyltransferase ArgJ [Rhodobacteraceae bacterium B1Z28]|uniref:Arginine biosynthesis bifunctional protein ArgJ n=1 Tax=Ruegeria haliotis TaxID=2747601 RepID=A0ABX2PPL9_9RHOB|nr:bifunctional glutamate N-acetyltransferase/amino-acid acetyltransferase ArgJ [Ruegeria haliotis]NVO55983.1 bifunctional glutamate N-acetyltransferase/amino-acid acetyltransferase ArgJ [Ruegeria haliotis]
MAKITKVSPLAPAAFPDLPAIDGVRFATIEAGVRYQGRTDVMLAVMDPGTSVAGVFTCSATRAAPVLDCQDKIGGPSDGPAAILVNSGNANAFTGHYGQTSVAAVTQAVATATGVPVGRVFTSSTGVIGEPLPHDRIVSQLEALKAGLSMHALEDAAQAIRTTDTFPKGASAQVEIDGKTVSISGIAKGSGMIAPDMATMLVYIFTDAKVEQAALQQMLGAQTDRTFNCITVDSDTSTSDSLLLCATGASGVDATGDAAFAEALENVMLNLAKQVVRDGEGATKFVEIRVTGAASDTDAKVHGLAIANSPLVKTAIAGEDPNWGRVVMAIGKSGAAADRDLLSISFGDILVAEKGWVSPKYREEAAAAYMTGQDLVIAVDLGLGEGMSTVWTCDLTHGYIEINADYRS